MTDEERQKILEEMREAFRKARPDLNLPPARKDGSGSSAGMLPETTGNTDAIVPAGNKEEVQAKKEILRETAREKPKTIAKMIKKYTDWNGRK